MLTVAFLLLCIMSFCGVWHFYYCHNECHNAASVINCCVEWHFDDCGIFIAMLNVIMLPVAGRTNKFFVLLTYFIYGADPICQMAFTRKTDSQNLLNFLPKICQTIQKSLFRKQNRFNWRTSFRRPRTRPSTSSRGSSSTILMVSMLENFFPSSLTMRLNKLESLALETLSSQVLEFQGKARANPIRAPFRCFLLG